VNALDEREGQRNIVITCLIGVETSNTGKVIAELIKFALHAKATRGNIEETY
jgi:hypothetical protein